MEQIRKGADGFYLSEEGLLEYVCFDGRMRTASLRLPCGGYCEMTSAKAHLESAFSAKRVVLKSVRSERQVFLGAGVFLRRRFRGAMAAHLYDAADQLGAEEADCFVCVRWSTPLTSQNGDVSDRDLADR